MNVSRHLRSVSFKLLLAGGLLLAVTAAHAVEIPESMIRDQVTAHVLQRVRQVVSSQDANRIQVNILQIPAGALQFPETENASQVQVTVESPLGEVYSSRAIVRVRLSAGERTRELGVPVEVLVQKPVWVIKNAVTAGQALRASDFETKVRHLGNNYVNAVGAEQPLEQYVARINLRAGDLLDKRSIQLPPDVRYNDEVRILVNAGNGMTVTVPGLALGNARIGETVRVRQTQYKRKYYTAKVIDKNRVLVEM